MSDGEYWNSEAKRLKNSTDIKELTAFIESNEEPDSFPDDDGGCGDMMVTNLLGIATARLAELKKSND